MAKKSNKKPCDLLCPKCGSEKIYREFWERGKKESNHCGQKEDRENKFVKISYFEIIGQKDHIQHHCRCCQFSWETEPISAPLNIESKGREKCKK